MVKVCVLNVHIRKFIFIKFYKILDLNMRAMFVKKINTKTQFYLKMQF